MVLLDDFGRGRCASLGFAGSEGMTSSCFAVLRTGSREESWSRSRRLKEVDSTRWTQAVSMPSFRLHRLSWAFSLSLKLGTHEAPLGSQCGPPF